MWSPRWHILQVIPEEDSSSSLFLVFSELYFQRCSNMPCFPAVQLEYNLREELLPYEHPLTSSKGGSLHLNLSRVELARRRWEIAELDRVHGGVGEGGRWGLVFTVLPWGHVLFLGQYNLDCCFLLHCTAFRYDSAVTPPPPQETL